MCRLEEAAAADGEVLAAGGGDAPPAAAEPLRLTRRGGGAGGTAACCPSGRPVACAAASVLVAAAGVASLVAARPRAFSGHTVSAEQQATSTWVLTHPGKGCSNSDAIRIRPDSSAVEVDACGLRCAHQEGCVAFNYQIGVPEECAHGSGEKGSCLLFSAECDLEDDPCLDVYEMQQAPAGAAAEAAAEGPAAEDDCAGTSEPCWESRCCRDAADTCFAKDLGWAQCMQSCAAEERPNEDEVVATGWLCIPVVREYTEAASEDVAGPVGKESSALPWVISDCADEGEYCLGKSCCNQDMTCFEKHPLFAACKKECRPGVDEAEPEEQQTAWSCEEVAPPSPTPTGDGASLFCFALMVPGSYEVQLLEAQLAQRAGVFGCDDSAVYSNASVRLRAEAWSVRTQVLEGSLDSELGGVYYTALNADVFVRVWKKVFAGGEFAGHDWTVKVDPDAVLMPARLKHHVANYKYLQNKKDSVFLSNCKDGLHGPVEVLSLGAMREFRGGIGGCVEAFEGEFDKFGEDVFLRHCLTHLGVSRLDDYGLLKETHCDPFPGEPMPCTMGKVAFHPLKTPDDWLQCLAQASQEDAESGQATRATPALAM